MKRILIFLLYVIGCCSLNAQVKLHSHNDYEKPLPLLTALQHRAYSIEADVFLVRGQLLVAHTLKETNKRKTLSTLYLDPIVNAFKKHHGRLTADSSYSPSLMIDIKQNGPEVLSELVRLLDPVKKYFDRSINPHAVQIIISGDRGPVEKWSEYPSYIMFDGRPFETYDDRAIEKIAMVSDNYFKYLSARTNIGDSVKIRAVVKIAHDWKKPFRFWGSPDNEGIWKLLDYNGVDIINTDKIAACREFFSKRK